MLKIQENVENFSGGVSSGVREGGYSIGETDPNTENIKSLLDFLLGSGYSTGRLPQSTAVNNQRFSAAEPIDNQVDFLIGNRKLQLLLLFQEENQNMAAPNVDEIRKRLAKIKAQAF